MCKNYWLNIILKLKNIFTLKFNDSKFEKLVNKVVK